jgi:hypothetical protein
VEFANARPPTSTLSSPATAGAVSTTVSLGGRSHEIRTAVDGLDHPECVCWSPASQVCYAGGEAGQIYELTLGTGESRLITAIPGGFILGLPVDGNDTIYACDIGNHTIQRVRRDGQVEPYGTRMVLPKYAVLTRKETSGSRTRERGTLPPGGSFVSAPAAPSRTSVAPSTNSPRVLRRLTRV